MDLGAYASSDGTCHEKNNSAASKNKANRVLTMIKSIFSSWSDEMTYSGFIRPHLEFASSAWKPHLEYDSKIMESEQQRETLMK